MATATRSEAQATTAPAAAPERKSAPSGPRAISDAVLSLQRTAGNHAVATAVARPAKRALQRCGAGGCTCGGACDGGHGEEELLEEQLGAGLLRSAVARRAS
jgi:hypothetical protein